MFDFIANLLSWFYELFGGNSYFLAIAALTFTVLVVATPLTLQGTKSMLKMQILQPEIKAIQNKYGPDKREEMNKELMAYYQDNNINPIGGCIPMLFQIPVFLVLYRVILGLTRRATDVGSQFGLVAAEIRADGRATTIFDTGDRANFNPAYVSEDSELFHDLANSNEMTDIGFDLSRSASSVLSDSVIDSWPYLLLVAVVGISGLVQHRMIRARNTGAAVNPTQEMIMKIMPIFLPVFSFTLPAAIVVYFLVSNLYRIGQQYYITRSMYHGEDSLGAQVRKVREDGSADGKSSGAKTGAKSGTKAGKTASKNGASKNGAGGGGKPRTKTKPKGSNKTSAAAKSRAPGRNSSGKQGSARAQVQPRGRKKKKR